MAEVKIFLPEDAIGVEYKLPQTVVLSQNWGEPIGTAKIFVRDELVMADCDIASQLVIDMIKASGAVTCGLSIRTLSHNEDEVTDFEILEASIIPKFL